MIYGRSVNEKIFDRCWRRWHMPQNYSYRYELSSTESNFPARVSLFDKPGKECYIDKHWHKILEIDYILSGDLKVSVQGDNFILSDNEYVVINSNDVHHTNGKYENVHIKYMVIRYSYVFLKQYFPDFEKYRFEIKNSVYKETIRKHLERIAGFLDTEDELAEIHILSSLIYILDILFTYCKVPRSCDEILTEDPNYDYARQAVEHINEHYSETITLESVASFVGLSPTYFAKYFKVKTNKTFHTYLNDIRMVHALTDMENYGVTETEAALNNGFANVKSFIQTFKRNYKCTLSQYVRDNNSLPAIHGFNKLVDENIFSRQK